MKSLSRLPRLLRKFRAFGVNQRLPTGQMGLVDVINGSAAQPAPGTGSAGAQAMILAYLPGADVLV
ncbi:hypothetical protein [Spirosoma lacussanchae]|uniref:hypothetical protein n=1 Tax=Spirosoma lacussanchae TaxID=1884249 RepID=UPI003D1EBA18